VLVNVFKERNDDNARLQIGYHDCVERRLDPEAALPKDGSPAFTFPPLPKTSPPLYYDSNGAPIYNAELYPDFAEWQTRVHQQDEWTSARKVALEKARPVVEKYCAGIWKPASWRNLMEVGEVCFVILALSALYWALIGTALTARWIYRGFRQAA